MHLENDAIHFQFDVLSLVAFLVQFELQSELDTSVGDVAGNGEQLSEALGLPALDWLASDIETDLATAHVVLHSYSRCDALEEDEPVDAGSVGAEVRTDHRVADLRHFLHVLVLG